jgi:hypothetical protein
MIRRIAILCVFLVILVGCAPAGFLQGAAETQVPIPSNPTSEPATVEAPTEPSQPAEAPLPGLSLEMLKNFTYAVPDFNIDAALQNGAFDNGEVRVQLVEPSAFGDLNGDGLEDAVAVLIVDPSGTGTFFNLVALLNQNGAPVQAAFSYIGDRQGILNLEIINGQIKLDYVTQGPEDPLCCASEHMIRTYRLVGNTLEVTSEQDLGRLAPQVTP